MAANSAYALVQVLHNIGAVAVVGSPAAAWLWVREHRNAPMLLVWTTAGGWIGQILSGIAFGATSYLSRGELPEITGVALFALYVKVACAVGSVGLLAFYLAASQQRRDTMQTRIWPTLLAFGVSALSAAAFLRWFG